MTVQALTKHRVIVTGASQGFGLEIARHCLAAGADVALCARTAADLKVAAVALGNEFPERRVLHFRCDVGHTADIDRFYQSVLDDFGDFDVVINNAGIHGPIGPISDVDWAEWERAVSVNLIGMAYSCRSAIRHFKSRGAPARRGKIINISGDGATTPQPALSAYAASKAGLVRLTETLAEELRTARIDVNALAPGAILAGLLRELSAAGPGAIGERYHARAEELIAQGGMSMTRAAQLCVYLASPAADGITGRLVSAVRDPWPFTTEVAEALNSNDVYTLRRIVPEDRGFQWVKSS